VAIIAAFVIAVMTQSSIAVVVEMRNVWPFMQPSPKNCPGSKNAGDRFLMLIRQDRDFDLAFLNVINPFSGVALYEYVLTVFKSKDAFAFAYFGKKCLSIKRVLGRLHH
jgi:hypothetical protein